MKTERPKLRLLNLSHTPIFEQLRLEEALLRTDEDNWCLFNTGSPRAIVMGISGQIEHLVNSEKQAKDPCPIIRRFSGGGTVIVDESTLFVTFIGRHDLLPFSPNPKDIMEWSAQFYAPLFAQLPFQLRENDYVLGHKKIGGNAQYICRNRWLHHTSFLWDYDPENMHYLKHPPKTPFYRAGRTHETFLERLVNFWPKNHLFSELKVELAKHYTLQESHFSECQAILERPHRRATQWLT